MKYILVLLSAILYAGNGLGVDLGLNPTTKVKPSNFYSEISNMVMNGEAIVLTQDQIGCRWASLDQVYSFEDVTVFTSSTWNSYNVFSNESLWQNGCWSKNSDNLYQNTIRPVSPDNQVDLSGNTVYEVPSFESTFGISLSEVESTIAFDQPNDFVQKVGQAVQLTQRQHGCPNFATNPYIYVFSDAVVYTRPAYVASGVPRFNVYTLDHVQDVRACIVPPLVEKQQQTQQGIFNLQDSFNNFVSAASQIDSDILGQRYNDNMCAGRWRYSEYFERKIQPRPLLDYVTVYKPSGSMSSYRQGRDSAVQIRGDYLGVVQHLAVESQDLANVMAPRIVREGCQAQLNDFTLSDATLDALTAQENALVFNKDVFSFAATLPGRRPVPGDLSNVYFDEQSRARFLRDGLISQDESDQWQTVADKIEEAKRDVREQYRQPARSGLVTEFSYDFRVVPSRCEHQPIFGTRCNEYRIVGTCYVSVLKTDYRVTMEEKIQAVKDPSSPTDPITVYSAPSTRFTKLGLRKQEIQSPGAIEISRGEGWVIRSQEDIQKAVCSTGDHLILGSEPGLSHAQITANVKSRFQFMMKELQRLQRTLDVNEVCGFESACTLDRDPEFFHLVASLVALRIEYASYLDLDASIEIEQISKKYLNAAYDEHKILDDTVIDDDFR